METKLKIKIISIVGYHISYKYIETCDSVSIVLFNLIDPDLISVVEIFFNFKAIEHVSLLFLPFRYISLLL